MAIRFDKLKAQEALQQFRQEFINRADEIVIFNPREGREGMKIPEAPRRCYNVS